MGNISTNWVGSQVHFDCLVKGSASSRTGWSVYGICPAVTGSVSVPWLPHSVRIESGLEVSCYSMLCQLIGGYLQSSFMSISPYFMYLTNHFQVPVKHTLKSL